MLPEDFMASFILLSIVNFVLSPRGNQGNKNTRIIWKNKTWCKKRNAGTSLVNTNWIYFVIIILVRLFLREKKVRSSMGGRGGRVTGNYLLHFVHWGHGHFITWKYVKQCGPACSAENNEVQGFEFKSSLSNWICSEEKLKSMTEDCLRPSNFTLLDHWPQQGLEDRINWPSSLFSNMWWMQMHSAKCCGECKDSWIPRLIQRCSQSKQEYGTYT